jgi:hypothetical protein
MGSGSATQRIFSQKTMKTVACWAISNLLFSFFPSLLCRHSPVEDMMVSPFPLDKFGRSQVRSGCLYQENGCRGSHTTWLGASTNFVRYSRQATGKAERKKIHCLKSLYTSTSYMPRRLSIARQLRSVSHTLSVVCRYLGREQI